MSRRRSIRFRGRRGKDKAFELDITSLLDILVILLVFLLKNFNASGVVVNVPKDIKLPSSDSQSPNTTGVIVQVSPDKIWVDDKLILEMQKLPPRPYDHGGRRIIPLFDELVRKKNEVNLLNKQTEKTKPFSGIVNLVIDKSLKYNYLKKLMYTCAEAGFRKYKFVVLGEKSI